MNSFCIAIILAISINSWPTYGFERVAPTLTSQTENEELNDSERCEIDGYAEDIVNLMLGYDTENEDLQFMIDNKYGELEAYVQHLKNSFKLAIYGVNYIYNDDPSQLTPENKVRTKYFILRIKEKISEILYETCTKHFHAKLDYNYVNTTEEFSVLQQTQVTSKRCLCDISREGNSCRSKVLVHSRAEKSIPSYGDIFNYKPANSKNNNIIFDVKGVVTVKHQIIPRPLILAFTEILMNSTVFDRYSPNDDEFFVCAQMVNKRFVHSLEKIMAYESTKINIFTEGSKLTYKDFGGTNFKVLFHEVMKRWSQLSSGGNEFVGPQDIGPLDPSHQSVDNKYGMFQYDSKPIIGQEHYQEMFDLFKRMWDYVEEATETKIVDRLTRGAEILVTFLTTVERYTITPMKIEQWELCELKDKEMSLVDDKTIKEWKGKKFWAVKHPNNRSLMTQPIPSGKNTCHTLDGLAKLKWTKFIVESIKTSLKDYSIDESKAWSCNLTRMYYTYKFVSTPGDSYQCSKMTFDTYLYSKISRTREWHECIHYLSNKTDDWCQAWRRIMLNLDFNDRDYWDNNARPEKIQQDTETLIRWVSKTATAAIAPKFYGKSDEVNLVCYTHTNISSITCPNDCEGMGSSNDGNSNKVKRAISLEEGQALFYEREWFADGDGQLKCQCPKTPVSYWEWFKQVTGNPCGEGSPRQNSYRCSDLGIRRRR